jgi:hypothetical protein
VTALPLEEPVATAVVAAVESGLGTGRAGYGVKPASGGAQPDGSFRSYAVVYPGSTVLLDGTVAARNADAAQSVQVTYIGSTPLAADRARDRGRAAVLGGVTIAGRALINPVELADASQTRRDDEVQPPLWYAVDRYVFHTTPA